MVLKGCDYYISSNALITTELSVWQVHTHWLYTHTHTHTHKICRSSPPNPALFDLCCRGFALLPKAALLVGLGWEQLHCCRGGGTEPRGSQHHSHPAVTLPSPRAAGWGDSPAAPWPPFSGAPAALINTNGWVIPPPSGAGGRGFMELCSCV